MERSSGLLGKVREFLDPTPIEDKYTQLLKRAYTEIFQPRGFKRAGQNFRWFDHFESHQAVIDMILDGTAQQHSHAIVMNYNVAKMLAEMGHQTQVYEQIKDTRTTNPQAWAVIRLAEDLEKELGGIL